MYRGSVAPDHAYLTSLGCSSREWSHSRQQKSPPRQNPDRLYRYPTDNREILLVVSKRSTGRDSIVASHNRGGLPGAKVAIVDCEPHKSSASSGTMERTREQRHQPRLRFPSRQSHSHDFRSIVLFQMIAVSQRSRCAYSPCSVDFDGAFGVLRITTHGGPSIYDAIDLSVQMITGRSGKEGCL